MSQTPQKRGRPSKYASKEEKAAADVVRKRARRQAQRQSRCESATDIRFKPYRAEQMPTMGSRCVQLNNLRPLNSLSVLADAATSLESHAPISQPAKFTINRSFESNFHSASSSVLTTKRLSSQHPKSPLPQDACFTSHHNKTTFSDLDLQSTNEVIQDDDCFSGNADDEMFLAADFESSPTTLNGYAERDTQQVNEKPKLSASEGTEDIVEETVIIPDKKENSGQEDGGTGDQECSGEDTDDNLEFLSDDVSETDSDSSLLSDNEERDTADDDIAYSHNASAKQFLEKTWGRLCDCQSGRNTASDGRPVFSIKEMAEYWQKLDVPDAIGSESPLPKAGGEDRTHIEWFSVLSGGGQRPHLCLEKSQQSNISFERTWDVDSIIARASCLSINRGLYVSYFPPVTRNIRTNVHVFYEGKSLHLIPHLRLGSGRQSPQFGVYAFFPGMSHVTRNTSYLTREARSLWVNRLLLPAIRRFCPPDVIQHHPRSFDDVESKAYSRRRENCSGMVRNDMDMR